MQRREVHVTRDQLIADVWQRLPATKHALGRERVERCIGRVLKQWPVATMRHCGPVECGVMGRHMARHVERQERAEYGMGFIGLLLLSSVISAIVRVLIERWLENRETMMEAVK